MNWFNLQDLENRLIENNVSEKEGFYYLLVSIILSCLTIYVSNDGYNIDIFLISEIVLMLLITVIGLHLTFRANQNGDGKEYLKRYISLSFVIMIRLMVFTFLLAIPVVIILALTFEGIMDNKLFSDFFPLSVLIIISVVFYYFLIRSFKKVAQYGS